MSRVVLTLTFVALLAVSAYRAGLRRSDAGIPAQASIDEAAFPSAFHQVKVAPVVGPNVLLICVDTLRADHMSVYGYRRETTPYLDAFSSQCRVFDRAYATAPLTAPSLVSMLTGLYPYNHRVRLLWQRISAKKITMADHLRRAGYQTAAVVSNIAATDRACGLGTRFEYYDDRVDEPEAHRPHILERRASRTTDAAIAWLDKHRNPNRPFFLWVLYIDPHGPYLPPEDAPADFNHEGSKQVDPKYITPYVREPGITDGMNYVDRYDEEIAYTDREIGRLLDTYSALEPDDEPLIIVTADHGEQMMDGRHYYFCHGYNVHEGVIHIPLMVRHSSFPAGRESRPVSNADIAPTVLETVGLPVPDGLDGRSLVGEISARPPYAEGWDNERDASSGGLQRTFLYEHRKIVVRHGMSNIPRQAWAYDLVADPEQLHPLAVDECEPAYMVLADLIRAEPDPGGRPVKYAKGVRPTSLVAEGVDKETMQALKSLGYVE